MSLFKNLTAEGHEETQDRLGGFSRLETDVYAGKIKVAYAGASVRGAKNVTLILALANGQEYRETIYITNAKGENFWINEDKKRVSLPGFTTIDDLCQVTTDKPLCDQDSDEKVVNVWDPDQKKEMPKSVPVLTELTGKDVLVAVQKVLRNKSVKEGDEYVPTAETVEENNIEKVFHPTLRVTVVEAKKGETQGQFIESWIERNKGKTRDKRQIKDGQGGQSGRPGSSRGASNASPPQAGQGAARKSLFGNNQAA